MGKINSKKTMALGICFDSETEASYYMHLMRQDNIENLELQPQYTLIEPFAVPCTNCQGKGKTPSPKTGRMINCRLCQGEGKKGRQGWTYKPDFRVTYKDGRVEVVDIKGGFTNERFPLVRKMWERIHGQELIVLKPDKSTGGWKRM
jgi:hypothetical protein